MSRVFVDNLIDKLSNIKWDIKYLFLMLKNKTFRDLLLSNKSVQGIHKGQRCFIVGNGPSLRKMDLTKLRDEYTFTVNNIMYDDKIYNDIYTDYHVLIDPYYFALNTDDVLDYAKIELLKKINYPDKKPVCFTAYDGYQSFLNNKLSCVIDFKYLYQHRNFIQNYKSEIDLSKNTPTVQNVVQTAILVAIYMGFKEIFLIGCDMTSVFLTYEANDEGVRTITKDFHAYKYSENEKQVMTRNSDRFDNHYMLSDYTKTFSIFKLIKRYADNRKIKILNATVGGGLDVYERVKYENIFQ